jgi:hypothetical protein
MGRLFAGPPLDCAILLLGQIARRVLALLRLLAEVATDLAQPVRLDVIPYFGDVHRIIRLDVDQIDAATGVMALRIETDLARRSVRADAAAAECRLDLRLVYRFGLLDAGLVEVNRIVGVGRFLVDVFDLGEFGLEALVLIGLADVDRACNRDTEIAEACCS